ncbi:hypothetical protein KFL_002990030 [Klebsormidium nitens]|uniref:Cytochrome b561 domain-containing protein n=1 Tax=Klebsormidium nitens TaxID=105231 RepID=A0A1Y1I6L3_KLENI|nr:hypothetical protein KFL_002990030 [Klebsormidium nitens]|eukprot:GAQ86595.1 hypothetical protein KFL_002990030 [Klebsormidium nitens]
MSIGYMALLGEGILLATGAKGKDRDFYLWLHSVCQVAGAVAIFCGLLAILQNKFQLGKPHFVTLHARLGLGTLIITALAATGGLPDFYGLPPSWRKFQTLVNRTHRRIGRVAFGAGLLTMVTGLQTFKPAHPLHKGLLTYACAAGVAGAAIVVFSKSGLSRYNRKRLLGSLWGKSPRTVP